MTHVVLSLQYCILLIELFFYTCPHRSSSSTRAAIADGYCPIELPDHLASDAPLLAKDKTEGLLQEFRCCHTKTKLLSRIVLY